MKRSGGKPDRHAVTEEIGRLLDLRRSVPRWSAFGDDNHGAIEAQIAALCGLPATGATEHTPYQDEHADLARRWAAGERTAAPSRDWAVLARTR